MTRPVVALLAAITLGAGIAAVPSAARAQPAHLAPEDVLGGANGGAIEDEPPEVELVTFGVGAVIFEKYGHAALCLRYHRPEHPPVCFNYGVTNFRAGAVIAWNFLRGQQKFWVEPTAQREMHRFYRWEDRDIWRQVLPITGADARAIEARLWSDIREENRYYVYDHFLDNCTTRLRDMIDEATHGALRAGSDAPYPLTFRELGRRGLAGMPLLLVATDLVAGRQLDEHPTVWQAMFHPEVFRREVAARLGAEPELVYQRRGPRFAGEGPFPEDGSLPDDGRPELLALGLVFAVPLLIARWRRRFERAALAWAVLPLALLGTVVWGLAIVSSIPAVRFNEVVLVLAPLDAALVLLPPGWRRRYALVRLGGLVLVSMLAAIGVLHQPLWILILVAFLPMAVIALEPPGATAREAAAGDTARAASPVSPAAASAAPMGAAGVDGAGASAREAAAVDAVRAAPLVAPAAPASPAEVAGAAAPGEAHAVGAGGAARPVAPAEPVESAKSA